MIGDGGVGAASIDEIEVGCAIWSVTHQDSRGFVGGVVINILTSYAEPYLDVDGVSVSPASGYSFEVIRQVHRTAGPITATIPGRQVNLEAVTFHTRDARIVSADLFAWLGNQRGAKKAAGRTGWADIAVRLTAIGEAGSLTPRADGRYRAEMAARRAERQAER